MRQTLPDKSKKSDKWKELCVTTRHESQKSDNILSLRNAFLASSSVQTSKVCLHVKDFSPFNAALFNGPFYY